MYHQKMIANIFVHYEKELGYEAITVLHGKWHIIYIQFVLINL